MAILKSTTAVHWGSLLVQSQVSLLGLEWLQNLTSWFTTFQGLICGFVVKQQAKANGADISEVSRELLFGYFG